MLRDGRGGRQTFSIENRFMNENSNVEICAVSKILRQSSPKYSVLSIAMFSNNCLIDISYLDQLLSLILS